MRGKVKRVNQIIAIDRHYGARKSETWIDARDRDHLALEATYGVSDPFPAKILRKLLKVGFRLCGAALAKQAACADMPFSSDRDSRHELVKRQLLWTRSRVLREVTRNL
jgi:hypothetical protein